MTNLGFESKLDLPYEAALEKVTEALKAEGFGVLTSIDMKETMKKKLDAEFRNYAILGACNPPLAFRSLSAAAEVGLLLPCNVIVYEEGEGSIVNIINPLSISDLVQNPEVQAVARQAHERLTRVVESLRTYEARPSAQAVAP